MQIVDERDDEVQFIGPLNKKERRVLGVLIEKSLTTPEYYPLTLKALATGCNQKSNRAPLSNYDEFELEEVLDGLRKRNLVSAVQTAGGRAERFRHRLREVTSLNGPQLAIMGELLLRGRQQLGELRSRASRMTAIESLQELREELTELMKANYVQASGELQRRGIEVDHALYTEAEQQRMGNSMQGGSMTGDAGGPAEHGETSPAPSSASGAEPSAGSDEVAELREQVSQLGELVRQLEERLETLERQLGV